jgi:tetratricopeptide (TPR) repeat protein
MISRRNWRVLALLLAGGGAAAGAMVKQEFALDAGRRAYELGEYSKAVEVLQAAVAKEPQNGEMQLLLAKAYFEMQEHDAAIASAEKAVAIDPKNSRYHEWLARAYGEKAQHAGAFSAMSLARKTQKEFERAVALDERNFSARQALIEFDCSAPGIVGGGEDKARAHIAWLAARDAAEGHYAAGNCRRQKKDYATADAEFTKALESHPQSAELIYDIGDHAVKRSQPDRLLRVAELGESVDPGDPRGKYYRGVALVMKKDKPEEAERLLREYLQEAPVRTAYPRPWEAHDWLGKLYESRNNTQEAVKEYEAALKLNPRNKNAREALKRLRKS